MLYNSLDIAPVFATEETKGTGETNLFKDILKGTSEVLEQYYAAERAEDEWEFRRDMALAQASQPSGYSPGPYANSGYKPAGSSSMFSLQNVALVIGAVAALIAIVKAFK